jgi:hypothetical protein
MFSLPTGARQNHYAASAPILAGKPVAPGLSIGSFVYGKNSNPVHNSDFASSIRGVLLWRKVFFGKVVAVTPAGILQSRQIVHAYFAWWMNQLPVLLLVGDGCSRTTARRPRYSGSSRRRGILPLAGKHQ